MTPMDARETAKVLEKLQAVLDGNTCIQPKVPGCVEALGTAAAVMREVATGGLVERSPVFAAIRQCYLLSDYEKEQLSSAMRRIPPYSGPKD